MNCTGGGHGRLRIPVGGPTGIVIRRRRYRKPGIPAEDAGKLPATQDSVRCRMSIAQEGMPSAERQLPNPTRVDGMFCVEIRRGVARSLANRILDEGRGRVGGVPLHSGGIVQRVRKGVVEIQCQTMKTLASGKCKCVVVGVSNRAPGGESTVLRLCELSWESTRLRPEVTENSVIHKRLCISPVIAGKDRDAV